MGITDDEFAAALATGRGYAIAFLKLGPNNEHPDRDAIQRAHARRNMELHRAGVMNVVGPTFGDSDVVGVCIFDRSVAEAAEVLNGDPAIEAGIFIYEIDELFSFPGSKLAD